jgi:hypothetical protein
MEKLLKADMDTLKAEEKLAVEGALPSLPDETRFAP